MNTVNLQPGRLFTEFKYYHWFANVQISLCDIITSFLEEVAQSFMAGYLHRTKGIHAVHQNTKQVATFSKKSNC